MKFAPGSAQVVEIRYTAPTLTAPENLLFRYRLEGYDQQWQEAANERVARYTNLRPGDYRFQVIARNHHGVWNQTGASFAFYLAPHFWEIGWFQPLCWTAALVGFAAILWHFQRLHKLRSAQALSAERERIARDMHEELGAQLSELGFAEAASGNNTAQTSTAAEITRRAQETLDHIVWATHPEKDRLDHFASYFVEHAHERLSAAGLSVQIDLPDTIPAWPLPAPIRQNVFLAAKEAVTNVVKHAQADRATIRLILGVKTFTLEIADNGMGFSTFHNPPKDRSIQWRQRGGGRQGLVNMRARIESFGGTFSIQSEPGHGTTIRFIVPRPSV